MVHAVEAWLLADRGQIATFLDVPVGRIPSRPEEEADPKRKLVNIARRSRRKEMKEALVPGPNNRSRVGADYVPQFNPEARKKLAGATYHGASGLAEDVCYYGRWMCDEAGRRIGHLYPKAALCAISSNLESRVFAGFRGLAAFPAGWPDPLKRPLLLGTPGFPGVFRRLSVRKSRKVQIIVKCIPMQIRGPSAKG